MPLVGRLLTVGNCARWRIRRLILFRFTYNFVPVFLQRFAVAVFAVSELLLLVFLSFDVRLSYVPSCVRFLMPLTLHCDTMKIFSVII